MSIRTALDKLSGRALCLLLPLAFLLSSCATHKPLQDPASWALEKELESKPTRDPLGGMIESEMK